jgi:hypothetical protein
VAARLQTRFTPVLRFKLDAGVKNSVELARLIDEAIAADLHLDAEATEPGATAAAEPAAVNSDRGQTTGRPVPESS